jgi:hypothetical protein
VDSPDVTASLSLVAWRALYRQTWWLLENAKDQIEREQRREARRTGQPPPGPNTAARKAKLDALVDKYEVPFRNAHSADQLLALHAQRPRRTPAARRPRPRTTTRRRRTATARAGPDEPSEPEPPLRRQCEVCGECLADKYCNAKTCSTRCRVAKHRRSPRPTPELLSRYEAALPILKGLAPPERLDLLAAVVWPRDVRLREFVAEQPHVRTGVVVEAAA